MKLALTILFVSACAGGGFKTVPVAHWEAVPTAARVAVDAPIVLELTAAQAEETAAATAVVAARQAVLAPARPTPPQAMAAGSDDADEPDATWAAVQAGRSQRRAEAIAHIDQARAAVALAILTWRERRLEAATAHVAVVVAQREFKRAYTIDRRMNADESYDVASFRGQLGHAQERWYAAEARVADARAATVRAGGELAAAKEMLAQMIRTHEPALVVVARSPMTLSGWTAATATRRRGLEAVDLLAESGCRRSTCFRRSPAETSYLVVSRRRR